MKTILITGSTDGIGLETAKKLLSLGHYVLLHGRNPEKLAQAEKMLSGLATDGKIGSYVADLSSQEGVEALATAVKAAHSQLDVLINNAGIFQVADSITPEGLDVRFAVNTLAPYVLTQRLLPLMGKTGRVVNLSSAAQVPVDFAALTGDKKLADDFTAYAQSKLALTMWSRHQGLVLKDEGPVMVAVNPGSLLASKMVKEAFGKEGKDINIGVGILVRAALSDGFANASGLYFDNDSEQFADPHFDALNETKTAEIMRVIEGIWKV